MDDVTNQQPREFIAYTLSGEPLIFPLPLWSEEQEAEEKRAEEQEAKEKPLAGGTG